MERKIRIKIGKIGVSAELNNSRIAHLIWKALPLQGTINTWGDEIYFQIPQKVELDNPKDVVKKGDIGHWPNGPAICIFYGPTPISSGDEIRPASSVEVVGSISKDPEVFKKARYGENILIERDEMLNL